MTIYTVYKITNLLNNKVYVGVHKTANPMDEYLGSGRAIKNAIIKYGRENFKKEILYSNLSMKEAYDIESKIVNEEFVNSPNTYNIKIGGYGGGIAHTEETRKKISEAYRGKGNPFYGKRHTKDLIEKMRRQTGSKNPNYGNRFHHSDEAKDKISKSMSGRKHSEETKRKISESNKGQIPWSKGKTFTQNKLTCPHCNKTGGAANMKRYHYERCKLNF